MPALDAFTIWLNGLRDRLAKRRYLPQNVLLLLPHCLQNQNCKVPVKDNLFLCEECGRCKIKDIKMLAQQMGVQVYVASGGRAAVNRAKVADVRAVVAVACSKELGEGIRAAFPKRVVGILNLWPNGPCKDTDVDVEKVRVVLEEILDPNAPTAGKDNRATEPPAPRS